MVFPINPSLDTPASPAATPLIWDASVLAEYVGTDYQAKRQLLTKYLMRSAESIQQMRSALETDDYKRLSELCHKLKSSALTVGAQALAIEAQSLETVSRAHQRSVTSTLLESLQLCDDITRQAIAQVLALPPDHGTVPH